MRRGWEEVPPDATLGEFSSRHVVSGSPRRFRSHKEGRISGSSRSTSSGTSVDRWNSILVRDVMLATSIRERGPGWQLRRAVAEMREREFDPLAVVESGRIVGVISTSDSSASRRSSTRSRSATTSLPDQRQTDDADLREGYVLRFGERAGRNPPRLRLTR
jgi:hypothetical protein